MTDLATRIHAKMARAGCCEGYSQPDIDRMRAALTAVLGCHPPADASYTTCMGCGEPYPCREVRFIAQALDIETALP